MSETETVWVELDRLLDLWLERANHNRKQHYAASTLLSAFNYGLGICAALLSASVVVFRLNAPNDQSIWPRVVIFIVAGVSGLQTFLNLGKKAETHRITATGYAAIRRRIEETIALPSSMRGDPKSALDEVRATLDALAKGAPSVPGMLSRKQPPDPIFEHRVDDRATPVASETGS